jgi:AcrR family transcriptional regulator
MPRPRTIDDDAVLDAADRIVERGGPAAVTFASVAAEVGLAPATLVQRFGTKRGLLLATTIRGWQSIVDTLSRERDARESPLEALLAALAELTADSTREALANGIAFLHIDLSDPEFHAHAVTGATRMRDRIADLLSDAISAGELVPETDPKLLAGAVLTSYNGALITWAMYGEGAVDEYVRSQVEFLLGAWRQGGREAP